MIDDTTFSKSTGVKLTIGDVIGLMAFSVFIDRRFGSLEADSASQASSVETISRRQNTYIDRRNNQHQDFADDLRQMNDRLDRLCEALASRESEVICND